MANECINVYMNNPTAGAKDGTCVSNGTFTSPIKFNFSADDSGVTQQTLKLAIRTETGFKTVGETIIKAHDLKENTHLAWTTDEVFTSEISTTDEITDTNKIFYIHNRAHTEVEIIDSEHAEKIFEEPGQDRSVKLEVQYMIKKIAS